MKKELWKYIRNISIILLLSSSIIIGVLFKYEGALFYIAFGIPVLITSLFLLVGLSALLLIISLFKLKKGKNKNDSKSK